MKKFLLIFGGVVLIAAAVVGVILWWWDELYFVIKGFVGFGIAFAGLILIAVGVTESSETQNESACAINPKEENLSKTSEEEKEKLEKEEEK